MTAKNSDPEVAELINMASFLDPRFRTQHLSQEESLVIKARVVREGESVSAVPSGPDAVTSETPPQSAEKAHGQATEENQRNKQRKSLGSFFKQAAAAEVSISVSDTEKIEAELKLLNWPSGRQ